MIGNVANDNEEGKAPLVVEINVTKVKGQNFDEMEFHIGRLRGGRSIPVLGMDGPT